MLRVLTTTLLAATFALLSPGAIALSDDDSEHSADESGDDDTEQASKHFRSLNAQADESAEQGDFQDAIQLWRAAIPYDKSPYVECRGALQRLYIRVAQHVVMMVANGTLDDDAAFEWFKARVSNLWGNSSCNSP